MLELLPNMNAILRRGKDNSQAFQVCADLGARGQPRGGEDGGARRRVGQASGCFMACIPLNPNLNSKTRIMGGRGEQWGKGLSGCFMTCIPMSHPLLISSSDSRGVSARGKGAVRGLGARQRPGFRV